MDTGFFVVTRFHKRGIEMQLKHVRRPSIRRRLVFCSERSEDPFSPSPTEVLIFMTKLFQEGKGYTCSLNVARTSVVLFSLNDSSSVGYHLLVCTCMYGVFNQKPYLPWYGVTWDADLVLVFFRKWSPANCLSLPRLSLNVIMLCLFVFGFFFLFVLSSF